MIFLDQTLSVLSLLISKTSKQLITPTMVNPTNPTVILQFLSAAGSFLVFFIYCELQMSRPVNQTVLGSTDPHLASMMEQSALTTIQLQQKSILVKASLHQIAFFQIAGMFIFTYGITCSPSVKLLDLQVSLAVLFSVAFCGFMCGATLNPCVALMNMIRKENKITWRILIVLFFSQIIGTLMGGALGYALNGVELHGFLPGQTTPSYLARLCVGEAIGSFILVFFIMHISNPNTTYIENEIQGYVVVSLFVYIGRRFSPLSGMSLNFTISIVFAILADLENGEVNQFRYVWIYILGDLIGTVLATLFYDYFYEPLSQHHRRKVKQ